jgi:hypothetical protein
MHLTFRKLLHEHLVFHLPKCNKRMDLSVLLQKVFYEAQ